MSDNLVFEGLTVAPNVVETITRIAAGEVEGVTAVETGAVAGAASLLKAKVPAVEIGTDADGGLTVAVHVSVAYGQKLRELGEAVQAAIHDALVGQLGVEPTGVDVYIDALSFASGDDGDPR